MPECFTVLPHGIFLLLYKIFGQNFFWKNGMRSVKLFLNKPDKSDKVDAMKQATVKDFRQMVKQTKS